MQSTDCTHLFDTMPYNQIRRGNFEVTESTSGIASANAVGKLVRLYNNNIIIIIMIPATDHEACYIVRLRII